MILSPAKLIAAVEKNTIISMIIQFKYIRKTILLLTVLSLSNCNSTRLALENTQSVDSSYVSKVWVADKGDGTYQNPILFADYSDPDVVRVGDDYYMTASSFNCIPGLPILHSKDLVNWKIVNHALKIQTPASHAYSTETTATIASLPAFGRKMPAIYACRKLP